MSCGLVAVSEEGRRRNAGVGVGGGCWWWRGEGRRRGMGVVVVSDGVKPIRTGQRLSLI